MLGRPPDGLFACSVCKHAPLSISGLSSSLGVLAGLTNSLLPASACRHAPEEGRQPEQAGGTLPVLATGRSAAVKRDKGLPVSGRQPAVDAAGPEGIIHFAVHDSGIGISLADLRQLFQPFSQVGLRLVPSPRCETLGSPCCADTHRAAGALCLAW